MQKMIQDILTFSRVGREESEIETVDCKQTVDEVLAEFENNIAERNARVIVRRSPCHEYQRDSDARAVSEPDQQCT